MVAPKGIRDSFAILKHCSPKGIPMIVIHSNTPFNTATQARGIPLKISQKTLAMTDTLPPPYSISFPNGKNVNDASLKHCLPIGMPMIVMLHRSPAITHEKPSHSPQARNQIIFPKQPMMYLLRLYTSSKVIIKLRFLYYTSASYSMQLKKSRNYNKQYQYTGCFYKIYSFRWL